MRKLTKEDFNNLHTEDNYIGVEFDSGTRKVLTKTGANQYGFINFELMHKTSSPSRYGNMAIALLDVKQELSGVFIFDSQYDLYEFLHDS